MPKSKNGTTPSPLMYGVSAVISEGIVLALLSFAASYLVEHNIWGWGEGDKAGAGNLYGTALLSWVALPILAFCIGLMLIRSQKLPKTHITAVIVSSLCMFISPLLVLFVLR